MLCIVSRLQYRRMVWMHSLIPFGRSDCFLPPTRRAPSHMVSNVSTITQMSRTHPVFECQISSKKNVEKSRELVLRHDTTLSLPSRKIACGTGL